MARSPKHRTGSNLDVTENFAFVENSAEIEQSNAKDTASVKKHAKEQAGALTDLADVSKKTSKEIAADREAVNRALASISNDLKNAKQSINDYVAALDKLESARTRIGSNASAALTQKMNNMVQSIGTSFYKNAPSMMSGNGLSMDVLTKIDAFGKRLETAVSALTEATAASVSKIKKAADAHADKITNEALRIQRITNELPASFNTSSIAELSKYTDALKSLAQTLYKHSGKSNAKSITDSLAYFVIEDVKKRLKSDLLSRDTITGEPVLEKFEPTLRRLTNELMAAQKAHATAKQAAVASGHSDKSLNAAEKAAEHAVKLLRQSLDDHTKAQKDFTKQINDLFGRMNEIAEASEGKTAAGKLPNIVLPSNIRTVQTQLNTLSNAFNAIQERLSHTPESANAKIHLDTLADSLSSLTDKTEALSRMFEATTGVNQEEKEKLQHDSAADIWRLNHALDAIRKLGKGTYKKGGEDVSRAARVDMHGLTWDTLLKVMAYEGDAKYQKVLEFDTLTNKVTDVDPKAYEQKMSMQAMLMGAGVSPDFMSRTLNSRIQKATKAEVAAMYNIMRSLASRGTLSIAKNNFGPFSDGMELTEEEVKNISGFISALGQSGAFGISRNAGGTKIGVKENPKFLSDFRNDLRKSADAKIHHYEANIDSNRGDATHKEDDSAYLEYDEKYALANKATSVKALLKTITELDDIDKRTAKRAELATVAPMRHQGINLSKLKAKKVQDVTEEDLQMAGYISENEVKDFKNFGKSGAFKALTASLMQNAGMKVHFGPNAAKRTLIEYIAAAPHQAIMKTLYENNGLEKVAREAGSMMKDVFGVSGLQTISNNAALITARTGKMPMKDLLSGVVTSKTDFSDNTAALESLRSLLITRRGSLGLGTNVNTIKNLMNVFTVMSQLDSLVKQIPDFGKLVEAKGLKSVPLSTISDMVASGTADDYLTKFKFGSTPIGNSEMSGFALLERILRASNKEGKRGRLTTDTIKEVVNRGNQSLLGGGSDDIIGIPPFKQAGASIDDVLMAPLVEWTKKKASKKRSPKVDKAAKELAEAARESMQDVIEYMTQKVIETVPLAVLQARHTIPVSSQKLIEQDTYGMKMIGRDPYAVIKQRFAENQANGLLVNMSDVYAERERAAQQADIRQRVYSSIDILGMGNRGGSLHPLLDMEQNAVLMRAASGESMAAEYLRMGKTIASAQSQANSFKGKGADVTEIEGMISQIIANRNELRNRIIDFVKNDVTALAAVGGMYRQMLTTIANGSQKASATTNNIMGLLTSGAGGIGNNAFAQFVAAGFGGGGFNFGGGGGNNGGSNGGGFVGNIPRPTNFNGVNSALDMRNRIFSGDIDMLSLHEIASVISNAESFGKKIVTMPNGIDKTISTELDIFNTYKDAGKTKATGQTRAFADNLLKYFRSRRESFTRSMADFGIKDVTNPFILGVEELEGNLLNNDGSMKTSDEMRDYFTSDKFKRIFVNRMQSNVNAFDKELKAALSQMFGSDWQKVYDFINKESDFLRKGGVYGSDGTNTLHHMLQSKNGMGLGTVVTEVGYNHGSGSYTTHNDGNEYEWMRSRFMRQKPPANGVAPFDSFTGQMNAARTYEGALNNLVMRTRQIGYDIPDLMQTMNLSFTKAAFAFSRVAYGIRVMSMELMALKGIFAYTFKVALGYAEKYSESIIKATETQKKAGIVLTGIFTERTSKEMLGFARQYAVTSPATFDDIINMLKSFGFNPKTKQMIEQSSNKNQTLKDLSYLTVGLGATKPEQGVKGASYAMREAMAGQFISLRRRFEIMPEAIAAAGSTSMDKMKKDPTEFLKALKAYLDLNVGENTLKNLSMTYEVQINNIKDFIEQASAMIGENGFYGEAMRLAASVAESFKMLLPVDFFKGQLKEMSAALSVFARTYVDGITNMINTMFAPLSRPEIAALKTLDPVAYEKEKNYLEQTNDRKAALEATFKKDLAEGNITKGANMEDYVNRGMAVARVLDIIKLSLYGFTLVFDRVLNFFTKLFGGLIRDSKDAQEAIEKVIQHIWQFIEVILDAFTKIFSIYWKVITTINDLKVGSGLKTVLFFFTAFPIASANMIINTMRFFGESLLMVFNPTVVSSMGRITSNLYSFTGALAGYMKAIFDPRMAYASGSAMSYLASNEEVANSFMAYKAKKLDAIPKPHAQSTAQDVADYGIARQNLAAQIDKERDAIVAGLDVPKSKAMAIGSKAVSMLAWGIRTAGGVALAATLISSLSDGLDNNSVVSGLKSAVYRLVGGIKNVFENIVPSSIRELLTNIIATGGIAFALFPYHSIALVSTFGSALMAAIMNPITLGIAGIAALLYVINEASKELKKLAGERDANEVAAELLREPISKQSYIDLRRQSASFTEKSMILAQAKLAGNSYENATLSKFGAEFDSGLNIISKDEDAVKMLRGQGFLYKNDGSLDAYRYFGGSKKYKNPILQDGRVVIGADEYITRNQHEDELRSRKAADYETKVKRGTDSGTIYDIVKAVSTPVKDASDWLSNFFGFGKDKESKGKEVVQSFTDLFVNAQKAVETGGSNLAYTMKKAMQETIDAAKIETGKSPLEKQLLGKLMTDVWQNPNLKEAADISDKYFKKDEEAQREKYKGLLVDLENAKSVAMQTERDLYLAQRGFDTHTRYISARLKLIQADILALTNPIYSIRLRLEGMSELATLNAPTGKVTLPGMLGGASFNAPSALQIAMTGGSSIITNGLPQSVIDDANAHAAKQKSVTTIGDWGKGVRGTMNDLGKAGAAKEAQQEKKYLSEMARLKKELLESEHKDLEARIEYSKYETKEKLKSFEEEFKGSKHYEELKTLVTKNEEMKRLKLREDAIKEIYEKVLNSKWASPELQMKAYDFTNNIEIKTMRNNLEYMRKEKMISEKMYKEVSQDYALSKEADRLEKHYDVLKNQPKLYEILGGKDAEKVLDGFNVKLAKYVNISDKHLSLIKDSKVQWDLMNTSTTSSAAGKIVEKEFVLKGRTSGSAVEGDAISATRSAMETLRNVYYQNSLLMLKQEIEYENKLSDLQMKRYTDNAFVSRFGMTKEYALMLRDIISQTRLLAQAEEQYYKMKEQKARESNSIAEQMNYALTEQVRKLPTQYDIVKSATESMFGTLRDGLSNTLAAAFSGDIDKMKDTWKEFLTSLKNTFFKMISDMIINNLMKSMFGSLLGKDEKEKSAALKGLLGDNKSSNGWTLPGGISIPKPSENLIQQIEDPMNMASAQTASVMTGSLMPAMNVLALAAEQAAFALSSIGGGSIGAGGDLLGGDWFGSVDDSASILSDSDDLAGGWMDDLTSALSLAPARGYANGGVVSAPTIAAIGEGRYKEAVIPLPDGQAVPVVNYGNDKKSEGNTGVTIINVISPDLLEEFVARNPNCIVNVISADTLKGGPTYQAMKAKSGKQ